MCGDLQNPEGAVDRYSSAVSLYGKGHFSQAFALLEPLLDAQPGDAPVFNLAAACCLSMDRRREAETLWRRAVELKPDYADARSNLEVAKRGR